MSKDLSKQKTFSAASITALDIAVNNFIGKQRVDGRDVLREVLFKTFSISGSTFYTCLIYIETQLS